MRLQQKKLFGLVAITSVILFSVLLLKLSQNLALEARTTKDPLEIQNEINRILSDDPDRRNDGDPGSLWQNQMQNVRDSMRDAGTPARR